MTPRVWASVMPWVAREALDELTADEREHVADELAAGGRLRVVIDHVDGCVRLRLRLISATGCNSWVYDVAVRQHSPHPRLPAVRDLEAV